MIVSPLNTKASHHARSISLPSKLHPLIPEFDEHLCRLRASQVTSTLSISHKLSDLSGLNDCVDELLLLPFTQQIFAQCRHEQWVDELLDGFLRLLDICDMAKDALVKTREVAHVLQQRFLRSQASENGISNEIEKYLTSRKNVKKAIHKALRNMKGMENKCSFSALNKDTEALTTINMLREAGAVTLAVLQALLSSIAGVTTQSKRSGWSLVSKLMQHKHTLLGHRNESINMVNAGDVHNEVAELESSIQDLQGT